jgi:hypothetical protein
MPRFLLAALLSCLAGVAVAADEFVPVVAKADLDVAALAEWLEGTTTAIGAERFRDGPAGLVWTRDAQPTWTGLEFGDGKKTGARHLRIGFTRAIAVGTVVARGGDLSVLKPDAAYPGDPGDDAQWLAAQRVGAGGLATTAEAAEFATWVLPPGTTTRALRFTHRPRPIDRRYNGWVGGVLILAGRYANAATAAVAAASGNGDNTGRVIDQRDNGWDTWDNGEKGQEQPVSAAHPAWVMLAWQQPQTIAGLLALSVGAASIEAQVCTAPADRHPAQADEAQWRTVVPAAAADPMYPKPLGPVALAFPQPATTRGVRLRFLAPLDETHAHGHLHGKTAQGHRVWLNELLALAPLGQAALTAPTAPLAVVEHPPIAVRFHLDRPGFVTLVIDDQNGDRVRNLVAETRFPAGDNTAWWDGLDDRGRDYEAAEHHVYRIPGALVVPQTYRVRGLVRDDLALSYEFSFYTNGKPPWETADGSGWWLANHSPPQAACFVPAGRTKDGLECMLLGSPVTEGGSGLAWVDLDGRKRYGIGWIGGNWTGAAFLAADRGARRVPAWYAYTGSAFEGELRLNGLRAEGGGPQGGDGQVLKWNFPSKADCDLAGLAAYDGVVVCSLPRLDRLLLIDGNDGRILGQVPCAHPGGVAFDAQGRLLAISGTTVVRMAVPADLVERVAGKRLPRAGWKASASTGDAAKAIDDGAGTRWDTGRPQRPGDWFQIDLGARQTVARIVQDVRRSANDFPRAFEVHASDDGVSWGPALAAGPGAASVTETTIAPVTARFIRLVSTGADPGSFWSIDDLQLYGPGAPLPALAATVVVAAGLEDPHGLCAEAGRIYVADHGRSHQVKVFGDDGALQRVIGRPGEPGVGPYDPLHLNRPMGMAVDSRGRLWVAESDHQPKRVSVWKPDGSLDRAFYGPARYGEGGTIDAADKSRLFLMGMELKLDWDKGTDAVKNVFWREGRGLNLGGNGDWGFGPEHSLRVQGRDYLTSSFNANPTNAPGVVGIWRNADGVATPIAAAGRAREWPPVADAFAKLSRFSVRWTGRVVPAVSGEVAFHTLSDDGVRLRVDGKPVIDDWNGHGPTEDTGTIALTAGKPVELALEWFNAAGGARIRLQWSGPGLSKATIPADHLIPAGATAPGGLRGEYFDGEHFERARFSRVDAQIDLDVPGGVIEIPGRQGDAQAMRARLPAGADFDRDQLLFAWSDRNHDGAVQADEVSFRKDEVGGMTVQADLSLATSTALLLAPTGIDAAGVPLYDATAATALVPGGRGPSTSGGGHTLVCADGWTVLTIPPAPFPAQSSLAGAKGGAVKWTYPNLWPGLHPSHSSPTPEFPGEVIGTTRVVGLPFKPVGSDAGWCWAINGNKGCIYVFTSDGLFVATLFKDSRLATRWAMPVAERGMRLDGTTLGEENFWPTMTQTQDGRIYLVSGSSVVAVGGLESVRRLPETALPLSAAQLAQAQGWGLEQEARRQRALGGGTLRVALRAAPPTVDGALGDWAGADWATVDRRTVTQGDWGSRIDLITAAVAVSGDRLYAAWKTGDANLLRNAGTTWQTLFKSGGCLDLMIGADPAAAPERGEPVAGDRRLLVTLVGGKPMAVLYAPVAPGHRGDRVPFSSPVSTLLMDEVTRVDEQVQVAGKDGDFELSVPLALLGLHPAPDQVIKADIGILRGNGFATMQRVYWSNKATSITADVPSEARLSPNLWGRWRFAAAP